MSDNFASSAALGYLAGRYSGAQTAQAVNSFFDGLRERAEPADVNGLLQALQEQNQHIFEQNVCIEAMQRENAELRAKLEALAKNRDAIWEWARRAEEELHKRPQG